jgi:hypothetical protein
MSVNMVTPTVKASIAASAMDLNGHRVCLITTLTRVITEVAAIKVAGTINQGTSSINSRIVLILVTPLVV